MFKKNYNQLLQYINDKNKLEKYMRKSTVKAGLFEKKKVKAIEMANYLISNYPIESKEIIKNIKSFNFAKFNQLIDKNDLLTDIQKQWLKLIISFRRKNLLQWVREEE